MSRKRRNKNKKGGNSANTAAAVANYVENHCGDTFKTQCTGGKMNHIGTLESNNESSTQEDERHTMLYDCIVNYSKVALNEELTGMELLNFFEKEIKSTMKKFDTFDFDDDCSITITSVDSCLEWKINLDILDKHFKSIPQRLTSAGYCAKNGLVLYGHNDEGFGKLLKDAGKIVSEWFNEKYNIGKELSQDHPHSVVLGGRAKKYIKRESAKIFNDTNENSWHNPKNMSDEQVVDTIVDTIKSLEYRQLIDFDKEGAKEYVKSLIDQM